MRKSASRLFAVACALAALPLAGAGFQYRQAAPGYTYQFPRDHFEHPDFRTEWWYYTGNLTGPKGERYGFELVFFRQGARHQTTNQSAWTVQDIYLAHAALTDATGKKFHFEERLNRAGPGIAGASFEQHRIWNGNWSAAWKGEAQTLDAVGADFQFHLDLTPLKAFIIHGENGVSQKAEGVGHASHYVSFPRLRVSGTLNVNGRSLPVNGLAWMDHEWFTEQLAANQTGWDWFSIQLDNGTELMLFELRRKDGSLDPYSSGTFIDAAGKPRHLRQADFTLEPLAKAGKYPVEWRIRIPSLNMDITCHPILREQELKSKTGPTYWEGAVDYTGSHHGSGYLEMTGYDGAVKF